MITADVRWHCVSSKFALVARTLEYGRDMAWCATAEMFGVQDLFSAGGAGVPAPELTKASADVMDVLTAMGLESGLLCANMDEAMRGSKQKGACFEYDSLLCILSHRADRVASKYLKDKVKMPKLDGKKRGLFK